MTSLGSMTWIAGAFQWEVGTVGTINYITLQLEVTLPPYLPLPSYPDLLLVHLHLRSNSSSSSLDQQQLDSNN